MYPRQSDNDYSEPEQEPEVLCKFCEATADEPHGPSCPLYAPRCGVCGMLTQHEGQPCNRCQREARKGAA